MLGSGMRRHSSNTSLNDTVLIRDGALTPSSCPAMAAAGYAPLPPRLSCLAPIGKHAPLSQSLNKIIILPQPARTP